MKTTISLALLLGFSFVASAQQPSSTFDRGNLLQARLDPRFADVIAGCNIAPPSIQFGEGPDDSSSPPMPSLPAASSIPGVIQGGKVWQVVWRWHGNNADGPIAGENGTMQFANNDAGNVMELDPETGLARIIHDDINVAGAVSRSKNGALYVATRGIGTGIEEFPKEGPLPPRVLTMGPSYEKMMEAFGGKGWYVEDPADLRGALDEAMAHDGPALVNVRLHHEAGRKPQQFGWLTT